jgi:hypothetical protein
MPRRPRPHSALAGQLAKINPDAAGSLREGLADTLTVIRLGITGSLLKTVMSARTRSSRRSRSSASTPAT